MVEYIDTRNIGCLKSITINAPCNLESRLASMDIFVILGCFSSLNAYESTIVAYNKKDGDYAYQIYKLTIEETDGILSHAEYLLASQRVNARDVWSGCQFEFVEKISTLKRYFY